MIAGIHLIAVMLLIAIGLYAVVFKKNLIKIAIGISIIASGVNLFLISSGYRQGSVPPIFTDALIEAHEAQHAMALPTPQALTLTSIVISLAVTALILSFAVMLYKKRKTLDTVKGRRLKDDLDY